MGIVVEKFVSEYGVKVDMNSLRSARSETDKLKVGVRALEDEQRRSAKATLALRERLLDLRTQLEVGKLSQREYKKAVTQARVSMAEETNESKRTAAALRVLKDASREAAKAARDHARAEREAARETEKAGKAAERAARAKESAADRERRAATREAEARGRRQARVDERAKAIAKRSASSRAKAGYTYAKNVGANLTSSAITGVGNLASQGVGNVVDAVQGSFSKAVGFESQMADVAKVVDGLKTPTGEATQAYHKLGDELKTLSTRIAVTPNGLAEMAAAAGSAGIKGAELTTFVEDAAKVMVAFDISSEEAGNGLAKLRAQLGLNQDEVRGLAGTINELSNGMASTAAEVLDATLRVGAVGKAANVSGQEIAAMTSAMISAGASSEIAATGTKNLVLALSAGTTASKRQREAFAAIGLDAEEVAKQFTGTAEQRIAVTRRVIEGLDSLAAHEKASQTKNLVGNDSFGPIASLTTNIEAYDNAMKIAFDTTAAGASVQKEFTSRSNTTANALQLLSNQVDVLAIEVGEGMTPSIQRIVKDMSEFLGVARDSGDSIGTVLGGALERAWAAAKEFIGPADEIPDKLDRAARVAAEFVSGLTAVVEGVASVTEKFGGAETAILAVGVALMGLGGPFAVAAALGVAAGNAVAESWTSAATAKRKMLDENARADHKTHVQWINEQETERTEAFAEMERIGARSWRRDQLEKQHAAKLVSQGVDPAKAQKMAYELKRASLGQNRLLGGGTEDERLGKWSEHVIGLRDPKAGPTTEEKNSRFNQLVAKKNGGGPLKPSEATELRALSKELDRGVPRKGGGAKKHKPETDYERDLEGEVQRLAKASGQRAGLKAASEGKSRAEQFAAAKAAEEATTKQLHSRVDSGMSLPGNFMHDRLQQAGFQDVAGRGTPPPIAVTIVDVKPMNVEMKFTGPVSSDPRELRETFRKFWREEVPQALSMGIREARSPVLY